MSFTQPRLLRAVRLGIDFLPFLVLWGIIGPVILADFDVIHLPKPLFAALVPIATAITTAWVCLRLRG